MEIKSCVNCGQRDISKKIVSKRINLVRRRKYNFAVCLVILLSVTISAADEVQYEVSNGTTSLPEERTGSTPGSAKKIAHPDPVTNLSAKAELYNTSRRLLQLVVSWNPSPAGTRPLDYNLHVKPSNTIQSCETPPYYRHIDNKDATNASIPNYEFVDVRDFFKVIPGCSYKIVVESNPHDGKRNASLTYTVPECVGDVCSCHHEMGLPKPTAVMAHIVGPRTINASWSLFPSGKAEAPSLANVTKFIVYFGHQVLKDWKIFNMTPVGDMKYTQNSDLTSHHSLLIEAPYEPRPNVTYMINVFVIDNRGCKGPGTNYTFTIPVQATTEANQIPGAVGHGSLQWALVTVFSVLSFVGVSILALAMVRKRCGRWMRRKLGEGRLQPIHSWRGVYKAVSIESGGSRISRNFPAHQERNIIYVEKEIEEAKARGDADTFEVSYDRLELGRQIGKGAFGRVFLARAEAIAGIPGYITVAVKKLKHKATPDEVEEFLSEIAMMKRVGCHPNIVTMLGCCTLKQPYCMLMEYVPCGDLLQYLRQLRVEYERRTGGEFAVSRAMKRPAPRYVPLQLVFIAEWSLLTSEGPLLTPTDMVPMRKLDYVLDPKELQSFAIQIARGMAHLEWKQITHRDLAARNVLIDEHKTLKISDFGLSRSGIYINTKRKKVPLRWLSLEAMRDNLYSSKSDVWAFAIVLWEIGTLGGFPYPTVSDMDLLNFLLEGKRLEKPDNCSDELYSLMLHCWSHSADMRPSFAELVSHLDSVICRKRVYVDFASLKPDYSFPPTEQLAPVPSTVKPSK